MLGYKNGLSLALHFGHLLVLVSQLGLIAGSPNQLSPRGPPGASAYMKSKDGLKAIFLFAPEGDTIKVAIEYSGIPVGQQFALHIHEKPFTNGDCSTAGGFWNPTQSTLKAPGSCPRQAPGHCSSGDLSGKHGKLPGHGAKTMPFTFSDPSLKILATAHGIIGKTVMIHDSTGAPIACDIIKPHKY
ncbi:hypothetical protein MJO29_003691 [Puccinia striiformis f. sp. tritici]|uniref:Copper/zinc superoxide dismutase n=1 Tax=Puccinia striiformis f. sp. tritici PST-78 TaxID=1165861 RepID=A0A0L0V7J4_9BASI|nr:hypothetical protein Pst134EB_007955 [Puccinia striiformis f. sp. tritici]KAI7963171.1 hypothetical protein MJO29_003598 [Puccinia striiformis f. sp. tritici]KAI7963264.1 hypothetical protein MJO29_003691 [Puccinia striiformis f. sp. tritici]KAI9616774.1 hypothetical protein KEM48_005014 [Puccinia striiformis f. sp. tritici PST-130]KNE95285.1 copper/zinc superoxide dismutase [Puccinia striiformis f. sp. tritici PST-78]